MLDAPAHDDTEQEPSPPAFVSADDVPDDLLDPAPPEGSEGDDSRFEKNEGTEDPPPLPDPPKPRSPKRSKKAQAQQARKLESAVPATSAPLPPPARARVVPLRRPVKFGTTGPDALAVKRALSHAGYLSWPKKWTRTFGPIALAALKKYQAAEGLAPDGVYGEATHRKLVAGGHFDKYGALLMAQAPRPRAGRTPRQKAIDRCEAYLFWGYHNRAAIHYLQRRPMHMALYVLPAWMDCSEFATKSFKAAGLPDPNGNRYNGSGWTGSLVVHGNPGAMQSAALNFYGFGWPFKHVTVGVGSNRCMSHGSEAGPFLLAVRYRGDYAQTRVYV